jgi:hypothetical protein
MKFSVAQLWILSVFVASLLLELCLVGGSYARNAIYPQDLRDLAIRFLAIYSVPLGLIISGIFAKSDSSERVAPSRAFWTAIALAAIWNALILGRTLLFTFASEDQVSTLVDFISGVAAASSFLTVAALTYFFTTSNDKENRNEQPTKQP